MQKRIQELNEELMRDFTDTHYLITQRDGEPGDQAYRTGLYIFIIYALTGVRLKDYYTNAMKYLDDGFSVFKRTWKVNHWGSKSDNMSRDNESKLMIASFIMQDHLRVRMWWKQMKAHLFFHKNWHKGTDCEGEDCIKTPDFIGIGEIRNYIRYMYNYHFGYYLLLCVLDLAFLTDLYFRKKQLWDYDSLLASDLIYANMRMKTPVINLMNYLYNKTDYKERIRHNYSETDNDIKPLGELYILACEKWIK